MTLVTNLEAALEFNELNQAVIRENCSCPDKHRKIKAEKLHVTFYIINIIIYQGVTGCTFISPVGKVSLIITQILV